MPLPRAQLPHDLRLCRTRVEYLPPRGDGPVGSKIEPRHQGDAGTLAAVGEGHVIGPFGCGLAWKKDPASGVIGVSKGALISMV